MCSTFWLALVLVEDKDWCITELELTAIACQHRQFHAHKVEEIQRITHYNIFISLYYLKNVQLLMAYACNLVDCG